MFVIQNIKTKKFVSGSDRRYDPPHQITSNSAALTFEDWQDAKRAFTIRRCNQDYKIVEAEIKVKEPKSIMNPRKLHLLNEKIKKEKYYTIEIAEDKNKISVEIINNKRSKKLKPYWIYNKIKQRTTKIFPLCNKNEKLQYTEEELLNYANKLKEEGFQQCLRYTKI